LLKEVVAEKVPKRVVLEELGHFFACLRAFKLLAGTYVYHRWGDFLGDLDERFTELFKKGLAARGRESRRRY
jgi:hypothetical protein